MKISEYGRALIQKFEALRLYCYLDKKKVPTIGWGHTGPEAKLGATITRDRADELFEQDLGRFEDAVNRLVKVPLNQNQFDALVSWTYNDGIHALETSHLLLYLNQGDYAAAAEQFPRWDHITVNGQLVEDKDLKDRRLLEQRLFLSIPKPIVSAA